MVQKKSTYAKVDSQMKDIHKLDTRKLYHEIYGNSIREQKTYIVRKCYVIPYRPKYMISCRKAVWNSNGTYLALFVDSRRDSRLFIIGVLKGKPADIIPVAPHLARKHARPLLMTWGEPDKNDFLVFYSNNELYKGTISVNQTISFKLIHKFNTKITSLKWIGTYVFVIKNGLIYTLDPEPGARPEMLSNISEDRTFNYCDLTLHPNGKTIVYEKWFNDNSRKIWIRNRFNNKGKELIAWKNTIQHTPVFSPDGHYLAFLCNGSINQTQPVTSNNSWKIYIWDMEQNALIQNEVLFEKNEDDANKFCWINNETLLYMSKSDPVNFVFHKWNAKNNMIKKLNIPKRVQYKLPFICIDNKDKLCHQTRQNYCKVGHQETVSKSLGSIRYFDYFNDFFAISVLEPGTGANRLYIGKDSM